MYHIFRVPGSETWWDTSLESLTPNVVYVPIKFAPNRNQYQSLGTSSSLDGSSTSNTPCLTQSRLVDAPAPSTSSWDLQNNRQTAVQLNESYKSVSSVTSGASSYLGRSTSSSLEQTHGSVRAISPTLPVAYPNAIITKSPTVEGSQDRPPRRGGDRKKKSSKNVLRETVINPQDMPGYKGTEKDIDKLLEFVEGNQAKSKKNSKDKKKEVKPKGNEKQMLSKAASLDENTLEYGSKKSDESLSRSRNSKEVEKKNATNITKSSTALSVGAMTIHTKQQQSTESTNSREEIPTGKTKSISTPLVNGTAGPLATKNGNGGGNGAKPATPNVKPSVSPKSQQSVEKPPAPEDEVAPTAKTEPSPPPIQPVVSKPSKPVSVKKTEDDKTGKLDESDGPYVLVQSKKKKEKKKSQQREAEAFVRPTADQQRRDVARARRSTAERRKSVGSVPGSENSECSDDDDSVRSLPAGECTPRERIPKPCSSSGGTPQTSYADIARMSRDESGKPPSTPITILSSASASSKTPPSSTKSTSSSSSSTSGAPAVTSDSAFPALSPPSAEKTAPINNAVWPCRPRIESETSTKEKSTPGHTTKSPDLASKEELSPLEASSLPLPAQSDISKCSSKLSTDKDSSTISKPVAEPLVSKPLDLQSNVKEVGGDEKSPQGPLRKAESTAVSTLESLRSSENCVDGLQLNNKSRKTEEKKGKSNKVSEEGVNKTASIKGMENGDISSCHQEPVVFCGGKFDSSQLPAGQNIGFEFGFGVIEALNDNVVTVDLTPSPNANPTPVELPQLVLAQVENKTASERPTRSQEQVSNPKTTENCWDKALKTDKTSKFQSSHEKQTVMSSTKSKGTSNLQGELTEAQPSSSLGQKGSQPQPNMVASATNSTPAPVPSTECKEVKQQETLSSASPANLQTEAVTGVSTVVDGKAAEMLSQGKLDVAQLFVPSTAANIPESLYLSRDFMDTYAEGLANLSRQGKVTYHRVD
ncbi:hypothetical protein Ocin01_05734 [Orchesella cincta]|uniref:Uncharacterized protein n=1 Tax=Orchesella cincta TaxID=48709 RepID=A0A1D2N7L2_ORCCI|nr:hypothetical protein Ocin01_05734 [Orchesella cincta]